MRRRVVLVGVLVLVVLCVAVGVALSPSGRGLDILSMSSIPVYPGASAETFWYSGGTHRDNPGRIGEVAYSTADNKQQVFDFYDLKMKQAGWVGGWKGRPPFSAGGLAYEYRFRPTPLWARRLAWLDRREAVLTIKLSRLGESDPGERTYIELVLHVDKP